MKVLITRAEPEAERLARTLGARGIATMIEPLMAIRFLPQSSEIFTPFLTGAQAVLFTSANGARGFAATTARRDFRVFAVGDATARAARAAGFETIVSAGGNVEDLAARVIASLKPADGALIHAAGSVTAGDLAGLLGAAGFILRRAVLYEAVPVNRLSDAARLALEHSEIAAAVFFSPRNAATFVRLIAEMRSPCAHVIAVALSAAVANALEPLPWRRVVTAAAPTEAALLEALERSLETERSA
jgi:uroporphyrinogen-III synthase